MHLNNKQRVAIWVGVAGFAVTATFPPWERAFNHDVPTHWLGYGVWRIPPNPYKDAEAVVALAEAKLARFRNTGDRRANDSLTPVERWPTLFAADEHETKMTSLKKTKEMLADEQSRRFGARIALDRLLAEWLGIILVISSAVVALKDNEVEKEKP